MKPKMIWSNLTVDDLERTTKFYTRLNFKPNGEHTSNELTSFFFGEDNFVIHFFLKEAFQSNLNNAFVDFQKVNEILFTLSAESKTEVDNWAKEVEDAGGTVVSQPEEFKKGYYGFVFADPDGHKFNVFYM